MAVYRLTRDIDVRDVASAHSSAKDKRLPGFRRFIASGTTLFNRHQCVQLYTCADDVIRECAANLAQDFIARSWYLPQSLDRVYDSTLAQQELG